MRPLQDTFFFDAPESDGAIRCVKRGALEVMTITEDDFVDSGDEEQENDTRSQQVEFPRKVHLAYPDPDANYATTKQTFERESTNVKALGEKIITTPIPFDKDRAARIVDIAGKVAWATAEGRWNRVLPREFTLLDSADCIIYNGKRYRIDSINNDDGTVAVEATYDRRSAYVSIANGESVIPPADYTSNLRGPTRFEFGNFSPLDDSQDSIGFYIGVCGILPAWAGGAVLASVDYGATYRNIGTFTRSSIMGHTETELSPGNPWVFNPDQSVIVKVRGGTPDSVTFSQILTESNAAAIGEEIVQYQNVTELEDNVYELSGLIRARHNTNSIFHPVHSRFVLLSRMHYVQVPSNWMGRVIRFYVQSLGTPSGTGYTEDHEWTPAYIQKEWTPIRFYSYEDGSSTQISWIGRGRLGNNSEAYNSSYFTGYQITITNGSISKIYTSLEQSLSYSDAQRMIDFGSMNDLDVSIVSMNRLPSGNSEPLTGII